MTGIEIMIGVAIYRACTRYAASRTSASPQTPVAPAARVPAAPPSKIITFVGAASSGKSSAANALLGRMAFVVGAEHGTTTESAERDFRQGYRLRDTPGLLDTADYAPAALSAAKDSELVIYVTDRQLYRHELDFLARLHAEQRQWDQEAGSGGGRRLALYINKQDIQENTLSSAMREREAAAIRQQVAAWIPAESVVFGAAMPTCGGAAQAARIAPLQKLVEAHLAAHK